MKRHPKLEMVEELPKPEPEVSVILEAIGNCDKSELADLKRNSLMQSGRTRWEILFGFPFGLFQIVVRSLNRNIR
jgi:hypothetical protein